MVGYGQEKKKPLGRTCSEETNRTTSRGRAERPGSASRGRSERLVSGGTGRGTQGGQQLVGGAGGQRRPNSAPHTHIVRSLSAKSAKAKEKNDEILAGFKAEGLRRKESKALSEVVISESVAEAVQRVKSRGDV